MKVKDFYVDIILPLPVKGTFCYATNFLNILEGQRVVVQFGSRKLYTGIVKRIHHEKPENYEAKPILEVLEEPPIVNLRQLEFWDWMSGYYMCNIGDVMNAALPSSLKLESESRIVISPYFDGDVDFLDENQQRLLDLLIVEEELTLSKISKLLKSKNIFPFINELIRKQIVIIKEDLHDKYKKKKIKFLKLIINEDDLSKIRLTNKQRIFINTFIKLNNQEREPKLTISEVLKYIGFSRSILNSLIVKKVFVIEEKPVSRLILAREDKNVNIKLSDFQLQALKEIRQVFTKNKVCLLHGVTASGKTEIYIKLIQEKLDQGMQVLYLLPEIALTVQIIQRLQDHFGEKVLVCHSHLSNSERAEVWYAVQGKAGVSNYSIILGTRSSLFLPFLNLGLIIVDEEHDTSFKQSRPSPRYHARDSAIFLSKLHGADILLGSATPCVESYHNTIINKYGLVEMKSRFNKINLPVIETIDIRKAYLKKQMKYQFSPVMIDSIREALEEDKQVILFHNRRGYSPLLNCSECFFTPHCTYCDVSLTYHKWSNILKCHYCGYSDVVPTSCSKCNSLEFDDKGFGTEQIEENLKYIFPTHIIKRMDYDTTRAKNSYKKIISEFQKGSIHVLVGTQMVTKGLNFDNVMLVGVLNVDSMLYFPDFRSYERAFQMMIQVAGRAGRKSSEGKVLIQTYDEDNDIFTLLRSNSYTDFIKKEIKEREQFNYPPYSRLIRITLKHLRKKKVDLSADALAFSMRNSFGDRVLGPEYPFISKVRNYYQKDILLKIEKKASFTKAKNILDLIISNLRSKKDFRSIRFIVDVDPL